MIPRTGPLLYSVPGVSGVAVGGLTTGAAIEWKWPRAVFCTGFLLLDRSGDPAVLANISLKIEDESFTQIVSDGQGASFDADCLALFSRNTSLNGFWGPRFFAVQRPVLDGDIWHFTVTNSNVGAITPVLLLRFDEPITHEALLAAVAP